MKLVFSDSDIPTELSKSIFLAGPSPTYKPNDDIKSTWRNKAIELLENDGYDGAVYVPVPSYMFGSGIVPNQSFDYVSQIHWERKLMNASDLIVFYLDRTDSHGLTTNIEIGKYIESPRSIFIIPNNSGNNQYIYELTKIYKKKIFTTLEDGLKYANSIATSVDRKDSECLVPAIYFQSEQFQTWYSNLKEAHNKLLGFEEKYGVVTSENILFGFLASISIYSTSEKRTRDTELCMFRTKTSYVVPYYKHPNGFIYTVLVSECRQSCNNKMGKIYEFPGGSSTSDIDPLINIAKELNEECGIDIDDLSRFISLNAAQTFSTLMTNIIHGYTIRLTDAEFNKCLQHSNNNDTLGENKLERIKLVIVGVNDILRSPPKYPVDLTMLGLLALSENICNLR